MRDDAPKKEKRPRPSRFQAAALPPGSAATSRPATARQHPRPGRLCVAGPRRLRLSGGLKPPSVRSCQSAGPVCGSTSATTAAATDAPAARTAPLATGASSLVRALAAKRMIEPYGLRRATGVARALASGARRARVGRQSSPSGGARPALLAARVTICVVPRLERSQGGSAQRGLDGSTEATLVCPVTHHCGGSGGQRGTPLVHFAVAAPHE